MQAQCAALTFLIPYAGCLQVSGVTDTGENQAS